MNALRLLILAAALALGACATTTRVVQLNPGQTFAPTTSVEVLLQKPQRAYVEIALLESEGSSEADLLNDAREKAKALGADAIVRQDLERVYHEPVAVYDPFYDPLYYGHYRWRPYPFYGSPWGPAWGPYPYPYRVVGGGYTYVLKALAIKYTGAAG
jgi:hypothetical protein